MAAAAGKHILCEKPLMTRLEDGKAMLAAAQGAGVHLFTAFPCRFSPVFQQMCQMVQAGVMASCLPYAARIAAPTPAAGSTTPNWRAAAR
jgi:1,5-anhydro-D-fructose reductase (1,5-anhydro-D-mannitol-forming)